MQVDAMAAFTDDLLQEQVGQARRQRALFRAREGTVQVAAVGQVAGMVDEAVHIDDRYRDQGAVQLAELRQAQQTTDDLHAIDLVAMDGGADKQDGPGALAADHLHRQGHGFLGIETGERQIEAGAGTCRDVHLADPQRRDIVSLFHVSGSCRVWHSFR